MRISSNLKRICNFFLNHRSEIFSSQFRGTIKRVLKNRFFYFQKVSGDEFLDNLRQIEKRPWNLHIELTNICNADCVFCAYHCMGRKKLVMADAIYAKALGDYAAIGGGQIRLETCLGDPLCDPDVVRRIRQAHAYREITGITILTNGINLDRAGIDEFLSSGIDEIGISSGPWEESLYRSIYRSDQYQRMRKNVIELLKKNSERKNPVRIRILFRTNLSMQKTLGLADYRMIKDLPHEVEFNTDFDTWLGVISGNDLPKGMYVRARPAREKEPCYWLYDGPIVFSDGSVGLCGCRDFNADSELIIGNIMQASLLQLWRSQKTSALRDKFRKGEYPDICAKCSAYANLDLYRSPEGRSRAEFISKVAIAGNNNHG